MNMDNIGNAMMILYDELKDDKKSKKLISDMDEAEGDPALKDGFRKGLKRLRELGKTVLADDLEGKLKGWL